MSSDSISYRAPRPAGLRGRGLGAGTLTQLRSRALAYPELLGLLGLTTLLNLWNLSVNGWANTYYSAAVRSMSTSWHNFLFGALDQTGLMTVDKPPLALWVQALSARVFGFNSLSILVPEALMGVVAVGLVYDMTRRRFGRVAGSVAGLAFALTPITVAVARHNNPDELLVLCSVAALWCTVRALDTGRTKWLVWAGVCVGLGFETKMGVALLVVPAIVAAYLWMAPRGRLTALRQLAAGGAAMAVVGLAWPLLVTLTPAADRPWISGTSDNSVWSLIFGYNGLGRVAGQSGGPGGGGPPGGGGGAGGGNVMFGGATGPFRLLQSGLGDQAGWLLGAAIVAGAAILVLSRLRRRDQRTGWVILMGGALIITALVFSFAQGIFHPYYVALLAPFAAALVGAGFGTMLPRSLGGVGEVRSARVVAPLVIGGGLVTELIVLGGLNNQISWAVPLVIVLAGGAAVALAIKLPGRVRAAVVGVAFAALLAAPAAWAVQTLGHATSSTFPAGGPVSASTDGPGGGPGGFRGHGGFGGGANAGGPPPGLSQRGGSSSPGGFAPPGLFGAAPGANGAGGPGGAGVTGGNGIGGLRGGGGFGGDSASLTAAIDYAKAHGGGTVGVSSQSSAAAAIISSNADVAGLGGFSGRESSVTPQWLAMEVSSGRLRWVITGNSQGMRLPGDTRTGSQDAFGIVAKVCKAVTVPSTSGASASSTSGGSVTMYDCAGRASAILAAAKG